METVKGTIRIWALGVFSFRRLFLMSWCTPDLALREQAREQIWELSACKWKRKRWPGAGHRESKWTGEGWAREGEAGWGPGLAVWGSL